MEAVFYGGRARDHRRQPRATLLFGVASGVSLGANYFGFMKGIELTTPANAQIIIQLAPLGLVMCGMLLFKENFKTIQKWGLFIAVLGFGLFFKDQISNLNEGISTYLQGNLWLIFAAITWIIYAVIHKKATQRWSPQVLNLVMYGVAFIVLSPLFTINTFSSLESGEWLIFCFLGFNTVIAYGALAEALKLIPSSLVGIIVSVNPLLTLVLMEILKSQKVSWIAYESIGFVGYLGAFFVVIGAVTVVRNSAEEP